MQLLNIKTLVVYIAMLGLCKQLKLALNTFLNNLFHRSNSLSLPLQWMSDCFWNNGLKVGSPVVCSSTLSFGVAATGAEQLQTLFQSSSLHLFQKDLGGQYFTILHLRSNMYFWRKQVLYLSLKMISDSICDILVLYESPLGQSDRSVFLECSE